MVRPSRAKLELHPLQQPRNRFLLSLVLGLLAFLLPLQPLTTRLLFAQDVGLVVYTGLLGSMMWNATPEQTYYHAQRAEPSNTALLTAIVIFAVFNLGAVALILNDFHGLSPLLVNSHMALSLIAIFVPWLIVHMYYALHYARIYYDEWELEEETGIDYRQGLEFPAEGLVCYRDFLYYSFTLAMCYQTSDVSIVSSEIRAVSLVQAVLSFMFVAVILGLVVNVVSNVA